MSTSLHAAGADSATAGTAERSRVEIPADPVADSVPRFRLRFLLVCLWLFLLAGAGTIGYMLIEGWSLTESAFMAIITLSTVGYGEPHELSEAGKWFTSLLIFACLLSMTCWTAVVTSFIVENDLSGSVLRKRIRKMIAQMSEHTLVCGAGPLAEATLDRIARRRHPVVLVTDDPLRAEHLKRRFRRLLVVEGNPTNELTLAQANVLNAATVVAATGSDMENLLIGITARELGPHLQIIAESNEPTLGNRMRKAGIDQVISPFQLCADRVAEFV